MCGVAAGAKWQASEHAWVATAPLSTGAVLQSGLSIRLAAVEPIFGPPGADIALIGTDWMASGPILSTSGVKLGDPGGSGLGQKPQRCCDKL